MSAELRPAALITGASAGIGTELARVFASRGHEVALVARRADRLEEIANQIQADGGRRPLVLAMDVTAPGAVERIAAALAGQGLEPQYVVNNAGFGLLGQAAELDRAEQLAMIDLNVRVLTELSLAFIDSLSRHRGGILNVGSVAGFLPGPGMAVYYATKAFVVSFSEGLHQELLGRGIRVTVLCPGPVPTEFQERAGISTAAVPRLMNRTAGAVAEAGYVGLMRGRRMVVPGLPNKIVTLLPRFLPRAFMLKALANAQIMRTKSGRHDASAS